MPDSPNPDHAQASGDVPPLSGGQQESPGEPPLTPPVFPQRPQQQPQPKAQQATFAFPTTSTEQQTPGLVRPPPGTLHRSPEDLTREVGWAALTQAVTASAQALYPNDPKAVALTVANTLQPYMVAFTPMRPGFDRAVATQGTPGTSRSKHRRNHTWCINGKEVTRSC